MHGILSAALADWQFEDAGFDGFGDPSYGKRCSHSALLRFSSQSTISVASSSKRLM